MKTKIFLFLCIVFIVFVCGCKPFESDNNGNTDDNISAEPDSNKDTNQGTDEDAKISSGYKFIPGDDPGVPYLCAYEMDKQIDMTAIENVNITISFGIDEYTLKSNYVVDVENYYAELTAINDKNETILLKEISGSEFFTYEYCCKLEDIFSDEGYFQYTNAVFARNETFKIPTSFFRGRVGWLVFQINVINRNTSKVQGCNIQLKFEKSESIIYISKM